MINLPGRDFELDKDPSSLSEYVLRRDLRQLVISSHVDPQGIRVRVEIMDNDGIIIDGRNDAPPVSEMILHGRTSAIDMERVFSAEKRLLEWSQEKRRKEFARQSSGGVGL